MITLGSTTILVPRALALKRVASGKRMGETFNLRSDTLPLFCLCCYFGAGEDLEWKISGILASEVTLDLIFRSKETVRVLLWKSFEKHEALNFYRWVTLSRQNNSIQNAKDCMCFEMLSVCFPQWS